MSSGRPHVRLRAALLATGILVASAAVVVPGVAGAGGLAAGCQLLPGSAGAPTGVQLGAAQLCERVAGEQPPAELPDGVAVPVGADLRALVDQHPAGTTFVLASGVHRLQSVVPKDGNVFVGAPGAVLNGARLLTDFRNDGSHWFVDGQTQQGERRGECRAATPLCTHPDTVFLDGEPGARVGSRAALVPGAYFFDYDADRLWFGSDPRLQLVEAAVADRAFKGAADGVVVRDLVVEKYATPAQRGAVDASDGNGWTIEGVTARLNHGGGLRGGPGTRLLRSRALDNGQIGITAIGPDILISDCEIARNNTAGFEPGWEAGGSKFAFTTGLVVRRCSVHDNRGPGLWTDIDNIGTLYEDNEVTDNTGEGIFHEISYDAVIRNNVIRRNGSGFSPWVWGAGIQIASSRNVEIYGNLVEGNSNGIAGTQQNRGTGAYGPRELRGLHVHDNTIISSGKVGVAQDVRDHSVFSDRGNRFWGNSYRSDQVYTWSDRDVDQTAWRAFGHDAQGSWS